MKKISRMKFTLHLLVFVVVVLMTASTPFALEAKYNGRISLEYWATESCSSLEELAANPHFPERPDGRSFIESFSTLAQWTETYSLRVRGYLHPPSDGNYIFTTGGGVVLSLGESDDPSTARVVTTQDKKRSSAVTLKAGEKYYIEALYSAQKNNTGLTVGWTQPDGTSLPVIEGAYLSPYRGFTDIPEPHEVLSGLSRQHPRILASAYDFAVLRDRIGKDGRYAAWYETIKESGQKLLETTPPKYNYNDPYTANLEGRGGIIIGMMETLGFIYNIERVGGDTILAKKCVDCAWAELEAAAGFINWNTDHFASTPRMAHAFGMGYDWFYTAFTIKQRAVVRRAIVELGIKKYEIEMNTGPFGWHQWTVMKGNWNSVINGETGLAILAVAGEDDYISEDIFHKLLVNTENFSLFTFYPDGGTLESPSYFNFKARFFLPFFPAMETALGTDFGMKDARGFAQMGLFPLYSMGPSGGFFNYSDGNTNWQAAPPELMYMAKAFNTPLYAWMYRDRFSKDVSVRSILWNDDRGSRDDLLSLPTDRYFSDAEVVYLRGSWEDPDGSWAGFAATDNWDFIHGQLDQGTFVFDALGERWATDFGTDNYNRPGYWDKDTGGKRWKGYRLRAEGHNTLVINPGTTPEDQHPMAKGKMVGFSGKGASPWAIADLTDAYKQNGARSIKRGVKLVDRKALLIKDEGVLDSPSEVWWFMHTQAQIELAADGKTARLIQNDKTIEARLLSAPRGAKFSVMEAERLPQSPAPTPGEVGGKGYRKLAIKMEGVTEFDIVVALVPPTAQGMKVLDDTPLARWDDE